MFKVSVIIPIFNMEKYLAECLNSVLQQTLDEIQIICINDGSWDGSTDILNSYALKYPYFTVLNQSNSGVSRARNTGIDAAKGEYVAFIDPDDYYPSADVLKCLYDNAKAQNVMVCGGSYSQDRNGKIIGSFTDDKDKINFNSDELVRYEDYQDLLGFTRFIYDLDFIRENHLYFHEYTIFEDPLFMVQALSIAGVFYTIKKCVYRHRIWHLPTAITYAKALDVLKATREILILANEKNYELLFERTLQKVKRAYYYSICKLALSPDYGNEIEQVLNDIRKEILKRNNGEELLRLFEIAVLKNEAHKLMHKKELFNLKVGQFDHIIIYGAGIVGRQIKEYLDKILDVKIYCFVVTNTDQNPNYIDQIPVKSIGQIVGYNKIALVLICTDKKFHDEITFLLEKQGFSNIFPMDASWIASLS